MSPQSRQLAAIMFTDIVGYTALMGKDEEKALTILNKNRVLHKPIIEKYNGRWIKELGDGLLISFLSVSDAVNAAIRIQEESHNSQDYQLRIGLHLGEVVFENEDVFGDGVNIASRIQCIARPGSIYISEAIHNNISNKLDIETRFVKIEIFKNVKTSMQIYEVLTTHNLAFPKTIPNKSSEITQGKSIAVLPFVNMSNDPEQDYFCDGISEEIIDSLAQLNNLRVIARTSAFSFKGKYIDIREIGEILNVTTLLEGSVRKSGNKLRITTKLVRVTDGANLWSNRYDRELQDIFSIQEDIATNVAIELKGYLTSNEKEVIRPQTTTIEAYDFFLKGRHEFHELDLEDSKQKFERAIEIDPEYAPAYAGLADVYSQLYEWHGGNDTDLQTAETYSLKALYLSPNLADSHTALGFVLLLHKKYNEAEREFIKAIALNPNSFDAYYRYGRLCFATGKIEKSAKMFLKASQVRLEDFQSLILLSQSLKLLGDDKEQDARFKGINRARKQLSLNPKDKRALSLGSGSLIENGNIEEGLIWINKALELYPEDPGILFNGVCNFAKLGYTDKAFSLMELAIEKGSGNKEWINNDPDYDSIREEPRFKALINKLK